MYDLNMAPKGASHHHQRALHQAVSMPICKLCQLQCQDPAPGWPPCVPFCCKHVSIRSLPTPHTPPATPPPNVSHPFHSTGSLMSQMRSVWLISSSR
jgi:hypothetical protein